MRITMEIHRRYTRQFLFKLLTDRLGEPLVDEPEILVGRCDDFFKELGFLLKS